MHANGNVTVSGGTIRIDAGGDGIDSNGDLNVSGGETYVSGPTSDGDSALDYDGAATVTGGTIVAAGYSGMAQNFGSDSTQGSTYTVTMGDQSTDVTLERLIYGSGSKGGQPGGNMGTPPDGNGGGMGTPPDGNSGSMGTPPDGNSSKGGRPGQ